MNTQALDTLASALVTGKAKPAPKARSAAPKAQPKASAAKPASAPALAPAAPAKGQPKAAPAVAQQTPAYTLGKPFNAKAEGRYTQAENWAVVSGLLAKSPATKSELVAAIRAAAEKGGYTDRCNAVGFVQARIRHGHLAPQS